MTIRATKNLDWSEWLFAFYGFHGHTTDLHFGGPRRCDSRLLYDALCLPPRAPGPGESPRSLVEELEARGYDTTTIEFRVKRKAPAAVPPKEGQ